MDANDGRKSLGYQQITVLTAAIGLTVPAGTELVRLQAEAQTVRMRDDGTDPTTTVGMALIANAWYDFPYGQFGKMKFIEAAATAKLNILYYGH